MVAVERVVEELSAHPSGGIDAAPGHAEAAEPPEWLGKEPSSQRAQTSTWARPPPAMSV